jgi:O-methyltransferase
MAWHNDQVSEDETKKIIDILKTTLELDGDIVELGCYKGDTSLMLAEAIRSTGKKLWIYDSFEGLPQKSMQDESAIGVDFKAGELFVTKREVKQRFLRAGLPVPVIKKAWFNELTSDDLPLSICFAFLDGDFYQSIKDSLKLVESKMIKGAALLVHDYKNEALPGVAKAVDEWLKGKNLKILEYQSLGIIII